MAPPHNAALRFPLRGGGIWILEPAQLVEWQAQFPGVDVRADVLHAQAWLIANPTRRKTATGMPKFFTGWFGRTRSRQVKPAR